MAASMKSHQAMVLGWLFATACRNDPSSADGGSSGNTGDGSETQVDSSSEDSSSTTSSVPQRTITWELQHLEPLATGFVYEAWIIVDEEPISLARFAIVDGRPDVTSGDVDEADASAATRFVVTIEPDPDETKLISGTKILAGNFEQETVALSISDEFALGTDFGDIVGGYVLGTPSTIENDDEEFGVWFLDPRQGLAPSLDLPTLPDGWIYEGWVIIEDEAHSTGRFVDPAAADDDGPGPAAGPLGQGPLFPGQDFVDPPMSALDATIRLTVEPKPDTSAEPFYLHLLSDVAETLAPQALTREVPELPRGTASLE
jgi:hypothetical protein